MTIDDGDPEAQRDERFLRRVEEDLRADPLRRRRLDRYQAMLEGDPGTSQPSWTAITASAGLLGVDAATLAVAVAASSSALMVLALAVRRGPRSALVARRARPPRWAALSIPAMGPERQGHAVRVQ